MRNNNRQFAVEGTAALKADQRRYRSSRYGYGDEMEHSSRAMRARHAAKVQEISYSDYAREELSGIVSTLRFGDYAGSKVGGMSKSECISFGAVITAFCTVIAML